MVYHHHWNMQVKLYEMHYIIIIVMHTDHTYNVSIDVEGGWEVCLMSFKLSWNMLACVFVLQRTSQVVSFKYGSAACVCADGSFGVVC